MLKVPGPNSQNGDFYSNDVLPPNEYWLKFQLNQLNGLDTRRAYVQTVSEKNIQFGLNYSGNSL